MAQRRSQRLAATPAGDNAPPASQSSQRTARTRSQQLAQAQTGDDAPPASQSSQSTAHSRPHTQSQRSTQAQAGDDAPPASQQSSQSTAQDSTVEVNLNWMLLDKSHRSPTRISIPRHLYEGPSQNCRPLFVQLLSEECGVFTKASDIAFWVPKPEKPLSAIEAVAEGWAASVTHPREQFSLVALPVPLSRQVILDNDEAIHLVIIVRGRGSVENELDDAVPQLKEFKLYNKTVLTQGPTPSEGAKSNGYRNVQADEAQVIYDGRWAPNGPSTIAPPIQIFHPIFDDFIHLVNDPGVQPTPADLVKVQELMQYAAEVGRMEGGQLGYNEGLRTRLTQILQGEVHMEPNSDTTSADGVITLQVGDARIAFLILELKRELGEGGCDPSLQAGLSMKRSWITDSSRKAIREKCCCPTFLVAGGGPWFSVLGGVFTDKVIVQRLTDMRWNALSSTEEDSRVYHNARILVALRQCLVKLCTFYNGLQDVPPFVENEPHPRYFPYPTSFKAKDGSLARIRYLESLETDPACVTYLAEICAEPGMTGDPVKVVVKFVARYGKEVHEFLAQQGHAPDLRYYGPLPGTSLSGISGPAQSATPGLLCLRLDLMHMVVMDYIHARPNPPSDVREQIKTILTCLHSGGYVFGDLRKQNILFDADANGKVQLIDFNWCGRYDMEIRDEGLESSLQNKIEIDKKMNHIQVRDGPYAYYPLSMSKAAGMWADGMKPLAQIRPQHDWLMLHKLAW